MKLSRKLIYVSLVLIPVSCIVYLPARLGDQTNTTDIGIWSGVAIAFLAVSLGLVSLWLQARNR